MAPFFTILFLYLSMGRIMKQKLVGQNKNEVQNSVSFLVGILVIVYFVCYTPMYLFNFIYKYIYVESSSPGEISDSLYTADAVYLTRLLVHLVYYIHPNVNPYWVVLRKCHKNGRKWLKRAKKDQNLAF